jgi:lipopolysaccharide export system permease protein
MQFLWKYIDELVGKGLEWTVIAELLFYASLGLVPMAMPLSVLLASIMTFGNLGEKNELFAMKAGGISLYRIMFPLLVFNIFISLATFSFSNNILPYTTLKMRSLLFSINEKNPEVSIQSGVFNEPAENFSIKADKKSRSSNTLENILIYDHRSSTNNSSVITAKNGTIKITEDKSFIIFDLYEGYSYEEVKSQKAQDTKPFQKLKFEHQTVYIELEGFELQRGNEEYFKNNYNMINNSQLHYAVDSLKTRLNTREYETWNNMVSYSMFKGIPKKKDTERKSDKNPEEFSYNVDTIYNNLTKSQKAKVLESALNFGRSAQRNVEMTIEEINSNKRWIARHEIEWHRKYTLSLACLLFYLIGAPLGAIIRKGGFGLPVIISVVIFLFYYIISMTFENTARELVFGSDFAMWISTYILIPMALFLTFKATNDSMRISSHFYQNIAKFFKRKSKIA